MSLFMLRRHTGEAEVYLHSFFTSAEHELLINLCVKLNTPLVRPATIRHKVQEIMTILRAVSCLAEVRPQFPQNTAKVFPLRPSITSAD
jgi:molybdopterin/thiamine biosynthesis adenylyltransferase